MQNSEEKKKRKKRENSANLKTDQLHYIYQNLMTLEFFKNDKKFFMITSALLFET